MFIRLESFPHLLSSGVTNSIVLFFDMRLISIEYVIYLNGNLPTIVLTCEYIQYTCLCLLWSWELRGPYSHSETVALAMWKLAMEATETLCCYYYQDRRHCTNFPRVHVFTNTPQFIPCVGDLVKFLLSQLIAGSTSNKSKHQLSDFGNVMEALLL